MVFRPENLKIWVDSHEYSRLIQTATYLPFTKGTTLGRGRGDGTVDPMVCTKVHVPYPTCAEMGTVTGLHRRKEGIVWVEYPGITTMYEVACGLLFPSSEVARKHLERVRKGKGKPPPPPRPPVPQVISLVGYTS